MKHARILVNSRPIVNAEFAADSDARQRNFGKLFRTLYEQARSLHSLRSFAAELQFGEPRIYAAPAHKLGVRATLDDAASIHHQNAVGFLHGR